MAKPARELSDRLQQALQWGLTNTSKLEAAKAQLAPLSAELTELLKATLTRITTHTRLPEFPPKGESFNRDALKFVDKDVLYGVQI